MNFFLGLRDGVFKNISIPPVKKIYKYTKYTNIFSVEVWGYIKIFYTPHHQKKKYNVLVDQKVSK